MSQIKSALIKGVFWSAIEKYSNQILSIGISMILARLLTPDDYGLVAIASVIIQFLSMFSSMGLVPAIIQRQDLVQRDYNSLFTFATLVGLALSMILFLSSWVIADFYENPGLVPIFQILSLNLVVGTSNMVPSALMAKHLRFKLSAKRSLTLLVITGMISIVMAFTGFGVYALIFPPLLSALGTLFFNLHYYPMRFDPHFSMEPVKRLFSFSSYQFLFEFFNYFSRNLDKLIIGKCISIGELGIYEKSYRLMQMPMYNFTGVINGVLQPVLGSLQDDLAEVSNKYNKIIRFISTISFPLGTFLFCCSYEIIHIFYGGRWDGAVPVFAILALSLPLQMIQSTSGSIFLVCNNTKAQFWVGVRNTFTTVLGFLIAAFWFKTIVAMAWAWVITLFINFICTYYILYKWVIKGSVLPMLRELVFPSALAVAVYLLNCGLAFAMSECNLFVAVAVKGIVTLVVVLAMIHYCGRYDLREPLKKVYLKLARYR